MRGGGGLLTTKQSRRGMLPRWVASPALTSGSLAMTGLALTGGSRGKRYRG
ncbi:MAG: hypothetical protein LBT00_04420 [Spirochaetaceae bacterium]|nr:hypothetical protein [Spirochaetaceae bacterium]